MANGVVAIVRNIQLKDALRLIIFSCYNKLLNTVVRFKVYCSSVQSVNLYYFFLDRVRCFSAATTILLESTSNPFLLLTLRMYFKASLSEAVVKSP